MQHARQIEQERRSRPVVEPDDAEELVLPSEAPPVAQWPTWQLVELIAEVALHQWQHAWIPGGVVVLRERFEHNEARPPVVVRRWADHAVGRLVLEGPVNETLSLGFQPRIVKQPRQRQQAIEEVRAALPRLPGSTKPAAVRADVGPRFIEMTAQAVGLNLQLSLEPPGGANGAEREQRKSARHQRRTGTDSRGRWRIFECARKRRQSAGSGRYSALLQKLAARKKTRQRHEAPRQKVIVIVQP